VVTDCAGDPLVAHSLNALKKRTKRSKAGTNAFSLTHGKPAALRMAAWSQQFSSFCLLWQFLDNFVLRVNGIDALSQLGFVGIYDL